MLFLINPGQIMSFNVRTVDLVKLNSLTKYPSISTYHALDPKSGDLLDSPMSFVGRVIATEKIDGTNARVVLLPDGSYIVGSREEFLYGRGDLIGNPALGIVEALRDQAESLVSAAVEGIAVYYFEVYGGKVTGASKQYTGELRVGYRLFDVVRIVDYDTLLSKSPSEISTWRENGGQAYADEATLLQLAEQHRLVLTPRLAYIEANELPTSLEDTLAFLQGSLTRTQSALDEGAGGKPEGLVIRTHDRSVIAKVRFGDYERTLKKRK
jgi:hypothetical protein